jgi:DNA adenine methylase
MKIKSPEGPESYQMGLSIQVKLNEFDIDNEHSKENEVLNEPATVAINSPFRYAGGKFYARKLILEHVPKHECYIEPMCGGASIFFAKEKVGENVLNDLDNELSNCLIHIRDFPNELADLIENIPATKERHAFFKKQFKPKNNLERAARWYYLNRTSYSGIMKMENCYFGYGDKYSMQPKNWRRHLLKTSKKLHGVKILSKDFEEIINTAPKGAFLFLDPPYFNRDQDKFYTRSFTRADHLRLMNILKKKRNDLKFILTYDNDPEIRQMYSWATEIMDKEWNYTLYRTDDQSKNGESKGKQHDGKRYKGKEVFILNYKKSKD